MIYDYMCDKCGEQKTNQELESFKCECSGSFRLIDRTFVSGTNFDPHYCPEIKDYVYSWKDAEKKGAAYRSEGYPNGLRLIQDNRKGMKECRDIVKNRQDFIQQCYAKGEMRRTKNGGWERGPGKDFKPGVGLKYKEANG